MPENKVIISYIKNQLGVRRIEESGEVVEGSVDIRGNERKEMR